MARRRRAGRSGDDREMPARGEKKRNAWAVTAARCWIDLGIIGVMLLTVVCLVLVAVEQPPDYWAQPPQETAELHHCIVVDQRSVVSNPAYC